MPPGARRGLAPQKLREQYGLDKPGIVRYFDWVWGILHGDFGISFEYDLPVTDADKSVEEGIRRTLSRARPRDAVLGEEQGSTGHSQRRWVVDPIDGTKNFVRGVPVWAALRSLGRTGVAELGSDVPDLLGRHQLPLRLP